MESYGYVAPTSIAEVLDVLNANTNAGQMTQFLAGGSDVLVQMRMPNHQPRTIVDIKKLAETNRLEVGPEEIYIGAAVSSATMNEHEGLQKAMPGLLEAGDLIGSTQVQGRATICGNLCNASPAGDSIPALIAAGGICDIATASGRRELPVEDFVIGVGKNALQAGEFLLGVKFAPPQATTKDAYLRFTPRTEMDIAVVGVAVSLTCKRGVIDTARVSLGAVAPTPLLVKDAAAAIIGTKLDKEALENLAAACSAACNPIDDKRGTVEYRVRVAGVLAKRAANIAFERAGGKK